MGVMKGCWGWVQRVGGKIVHGCACVHVVVRGGPVVLRVCSRAAGDASS